MFRSVPEENEKTIRNQNKSQKSYQRDKRLSCPLWKKKVGSFFDGLKFRKKWVEKIKRNVADGSIKMKKGKKKKKIERRKKKGKRRGKRKPKYIGQILHVYLKIKGVEKGSSAGRTISLSIVGEGSSQWEYMLEKKRSQKYLMIWDSNTDKILPEVAIIKPNTLRS